MEKFFEPYQDERVSGIFYKTRQEFTNFLIYDRGIMLLFDEAFRLREAGDEAFIYAENFFRFIANLADQPDEKFVPHILKMLLWDDIPADLKERMIKALGPCGSLKTISQLRKFLVEFYDSEFKEDTDKKVVFIDQQKIRDKRYKEHLRMKSLIDELLQKWVGKVNREMVSE
jgi:hypothetical protein